MPSNAATLTASQRGAATRKANREAQRLADEALIKESCNRGPRDAMVKAKENQVWISEESKKRRRGKSDAVEQPAAEKTHKKTKAPSVSRHPSKYDDIDDDAPSSGTFPAATAPPRPKSTRAPAAKPTVPRAVPKKALAKPVKQRNDVEARDRGVKDIERWAARIVHGSEDDGDDGDDEEEEEEDAQDEAHSDRESRQVPEDVSGSDFDPAEDEKLDENNVSDLVPTWTPAGEINGDNSNEEESNHGGNESALDDSDAELEYAAKHGLTQLLRKKRSIGASQLFESNEGVINARAPLPSQPVSQPKKVSQREQKLQAEEARWTGPGTIKARAAGHERTNSHRGVPRAAASPAVRTSSAQPNTASPEWPALTKIDVTTHGNLALNQSSAEVRTTFRTAEDKLRLHIVVVNAYEDVDARSKVTFLMDILTLAASENKYPDIEDRLRGDSDYARLLIEALSTRLSQFRGKFRVTAAAKVSAYFRLGNGNTVDITQQVDNLLDKKRYIYPMGLSDNMARSRPYENSIFTDIIQDVLVTKRKNFFKDHVDDFKVRWQGDKFLELPVAVVALAATAVHAAILDYRAKGSQPTDFLADQYSSIYETHAMVLSSIEEQRPAAYHRLLKKLFEDVIGSSTTSVAAKADANEILDDLDFDGLES